MKEVVGYETPSGNGSSGGHASGRGAPLEPTRPTGQGRFGRRPHEAEASRRAPRLRPLAVGEGRRNPRASGRPFASHPPGRRVAVTLQSGRGPTDPAARSPRAQWSRRLQRPGAVGPQPTAACSGRESNPRHPGYQPGALPLSYHDLAPPRFRIPARNTPRRPSKDGARRAAGPTRPAACLKIPAARPDGPRRVICLWESSPRRHPARFRYLNSCKLADVD